MGISFSQPYFLFLLILPLYFIVLWKRSPKAFALWQQKAFLSLRVLLVLLLIFSLAGFELTFKNTERTVVYVADLSASVASKQDEVSSWINQSLKGLAPDTGFGVVALGKKAMVEYPVDKYRDFPNFQAVVDPNYTDLAAGLRLAQAMMPENSAKQILLITDGKENRGSVLEQAKLLKEQGVRLDVLAIAAESPPEVLVSNVEVPTLLREGEFFDLKLSIESTVSTKGKVRIMADNKILYEDEVSFSKGSNNLIWAMQAQAQGLHTYKVELESQVDTRKENNMGAALTQVEGVPRVLVVEGKTGDAAALTKAFTSSKLQVETIAPEFMPKELTGMAEYESILLVNVPATALKETTMLALETYVRDLGRGLIMVGGEDSFGLGGYFKTPVEKALPVHMDIRGKGEVPSVGLVVVIDKSGSMGGANYGVPKMELAKEAAIRATSILEKKDQLGVVAFDDSYKWVVKTGPLNKEEAEESIGSIQAGGGTNIFPGLQAAYDSLLRTKVKVKHIILLTDGQSAYGGNYEELMEEMKKNKITLSTIAVGSDSDQRLLSQLAELGKGRYYYTDDFESIPKIFTKETIIATRSYLIQEPFTPKINSNTTLFSLAEGLPALFGYVGTSSKSTAETLLISHQGDPVLARWQYGLGRAIVWTSDATGRWGAEWVTWDRFPIIWGSLLSWTLPQQNEGAMIVALNREGGKASITAEIPGERRQVHDLIARVMTPSGKTMELTLPASGPGQYRQTFELEEPGAYLVNVVEKTGNAIVRQKTAGFVLPYSPEYLLQPDQKEFLAQVAESGGGQLLSIGDASMVGELSVPAVWGRVPLWPKLLALAALLLPLDIAARRFNWHLRWVIPYWIKLKGKLAKNEVDLIGESSKLLKSLSQHKEAREHLYSVKEKLPSGANKNETVKAKLMPSVATEEKAKVTKETAEENFSAKLLKAKHDRSRK